MAPAGMNGADLYTSGQAIQNQANSMLASGADPTTAQSFVANALQNLTTMGNNSAYFTPAAGQTTSPTTPTQATWWESAATSMAAAAQSFMAPGAGPGVTSTTGNALSSIGNINLFAGWNLSRVVTIVIGLLLLMGSLIMFSNNKETVVNLVQSVAKHPELLAE